MKRASPSRTAQGCKKQKTSGKTLFLQLKSMDPAAKEDQCHSENGWDSDGLRDDIRLEMNRADDWYVYANK